jgi:hypothetical protein
LGSGQFGGTLPLLEESGDVAAIFERAVERTFLGLNQPGVDDVRIPAKSNSIPEGSRTPFRAEAEQHSGMVPNRIRSVATLAF